MSRREKIYLLGFGIAILVVVLILKFSSPKIAYIRTNYLIEKYSGMKEASELYQKKSLVWQSSIDSLKQILELEVLNYKKDSLKYSSLEKRNKQELLRRLQFNLYKKSEELKDKSQKEDEQMTIGVLNQINSFIKDYGVKNGYTLVLGTSETGTVLYGKESIDITEEILKELNNSYLGGK